MTTIFRNTLVSSAVLLALGGLTGVANAASTLTPAGTTVSNIASLDYTVGGTAQPTLKSCVTTACTSTTGTNTDFVVDLKVNVNVVTADTDYVSAVPATAANQPAAAKFTVTNTGNGTQDFALTTGITTSGTTTNVWGTTSATDTINPTSCTTYLDTDNDGVYDQGTDTAATFIDELAAGSSATVFVACTFPNTVVFDDTAVIALHAKAEAGGTAGTEGATLGATVVIGGKTVNVVNADNVAGVDGDTTAQGDFAAYDALRIDTSRLKVVKSVATLCDPINAQTSPKSIPGALVRYTITVTNDTTGVTPTSRVKTATLTNLTDALDAALNFDEAFVGGIAGTGITTTTCVGTDTNTAANFTAASLTTSGTGRAAELNTTISVGVTANPDTVTIPLSTALTADAPSSHLAGELKAGETVTVKFNAAVK